MIFRLRGNFTFEAEDIDDAFNRLAEHFLMLSYGADSKLIRAGEVTVEPDAPTSPPAEEE